MQWWFLHCRDGNVGNSVQCNATQCWPMAMQSNVDNAKQCWRGWMQPEYIYLGFSYHHLLHSLLTKVGELRPVEHHGCSVRLVRLVKILNANILWQDIKTPHRIIASYIIMSITDARLVCLVKVNTRWFFHIKVMHQIIKSYGQMVI